MWLSSFKRRYDAIRVLPRLLWWSLSVFQFGKMRRTIVSSALFVCWGKRLRIFYLHCLQLNRHVAATAVPFPRHECSWWTNAISNRIHGTIVSFDATIAFKCWAAFAISYRSAFLNCVIVRVSFAASLIVSTWRHKVAWRYVCFFL